MLSVALAVVSALLAWWLGTGLILYLDRRRPRTFPRSMAAASVLLVAALWGIVRVRDVTGAAGAYAGFALGLAVWAWIEMSFLLGYLTGPRRTACAPGCRGARHFRHAIEALLWHELAIVVLVAGVWALGAPGTNHVAGLTLLTLWLMRSSTKLNLFLGVRNSGAELLPPHLAYLAGFFGRRPCNPLYPFSILASAVALALVLRHLLAAGAGELQVVGGTLLATLIALGLLEHAILVLPMSPGALWQWSLRSREVPG